MMVGKLVGAVAFLSIIALLWLVVVRSGFSPWAMAAAGLLFLLIGGFASLDPSEWKKKDRQ